MTGTFSALDAVLAKEIEKGTLGGCGMYVEQHGKCVFSKTYGSDKSDSIYKIYSMTKPVTLAAVMICYERGLFTLQDRVDKYIPEVAETKVWGNGKLVPQKRPMTIKHLLDMQSGIVYPGEMSVPEKEMLRLQNEMRARVAKGEVLGNVGIATILCTAPLEFQPGEGFRYGASADILAAIVEIVTGIKYGDFLKKEIFDPLGMSDTAFFVPKDKLHRLAKMYHWNEKGICVEPSKEQMEWLGLTDPTLPPNIESGGGGLYSTIKDYAAFCRMMLAGGKAPDGTHIVGRKTIELFVHGATTDAMRAASEWLSDELAGYSYGNLLRVLEDPVKQKSNGSKGEYGWDGLPGNYFMIDPEEDLFLIYMQQIAEGKDLSLRRRYRAAVYGALD